MSVASFNSAERQREKIESRIRDDARLQDGSESIDELAERNGLFSVLDPSKARVLRRRVRLSLV